VEIVIVWCGFAIVVGVFASNKGRSGFGWFLLALLLSPLLAGLFLLAASDLKKEAAAKTELNESKVCPRCAERVKNAALVCRFCGYDFGPTQPPEPPEPPEPPQPPEVVVPAKRGWIEWVSGL
jgi:ribosomal protein L40E